MKNIVMWVGSGCNEQAWGRILSSYPAIVQVFQRGLSKQTTVWAKGECICASPERSVCMRTLNDLLFSQPIALKWFFKTWWKFRKKPVDLLIAESNYAYLGLWLRSFGATKLLVFYVTDHLPESNKWHITVHRRVISALHRYIAKRADEVWSLSPRIPIARINAHAHIIPIYIDSTKDRTASHRSEIVYIGRPSHDHALDILFELAQKHCWLVNIIGDSPYLQSLSSLFSPNIKLHGFITDRNRITQIMQRCFCGYGVYRNTGESGYSYYGIPSKLFYYLSNDLPVITTNTSCFSAAVKDQGIGRLIDPDLSQIEAAITDLRENYEVSKKSITAFRQSWNTKVEDFLNQRMISLFNKDVFSTRGDLTQP